MHRVFAITLLGFSTAACDIDTDPAVFVQANLTSPAATVSGNSLGTSFVGGFHLGLHLGARASAASEVTLGAFSVQSSDRQTTIVSPLEVKADRSFPVTVEPGGDDVVIGMTFGMEAALLPEEKRTELCAPGGIVITGVVQDSLQDGATPADSPVFQAAGCP